MTKALIDGDKPYKNQYNSSRFVSNTHKECSLCNEVKPHTDFHKDKNNKRGLGLAYYCKECANKKGRQWTKNKGHLPEYREAKHNSYYKRQYGLSLEERTSLLLAQDSKCAICGITLMKSGSNTHTDHCHTTGKIRGILCTNCNRGLGHFQDSQKYLMAAIKYLQTHTENGTQKEGRGL